MIKGIFSLLKTGWQWRLLPREFGQWGTSYASCKRGRRDGVWASVMAARRRLERRRVGRPPEPAAGSVDSQSSKTATQSSEGGVDRGKKIKGRNRHLLVDTLGLILAVGVTAADRDDRQGLVALLTQDFAGGVKRLRKLGVDGGYRAEWLTAWGRDLKPTHKIDLEVTEKEGPGFQVIPWRWTVERTFAWLLTDRRQSRDYERWTVNSDAMIQLSMIRVLLNRLA